MDIEMRVKNALKEEASFITPASELKMKVMERIPFQNGRKRMKKRIITGIVAATVLLPTGAFASYTYLADQVFGSSKTLTEHGGTGQQYDHFESKLQHAQKQLTAKELIEFVGLLKDITFYNLKTIDSKGDIHPEELNEEDRAEYDKTLQKLQPYFDRLNADLEK